MARKLYENGPLMPNKDMGGSDFGVTGDTTGNASWGRHRGIAPGNEAKYKADAKKFKNVHPKRV